MGHQVKEWQPHRGVVINYEKNKSMHYNPLVDKQIRVPIGNINELRKRLKQVNLDQPLKGTEALSMSDNDEFLTELNEEGKENGFTLTRKP